MGRFKVKKKCTVCGLEVVPQGMRMHLEKKHGVKYKPAGATTRDTPQGQGSIHLSENHLKKLSKLQLERGKSRVRWLSSLRWMFRQCWQSPSRAWTT